MMRLALVVVALWMGLVPPLIELPSVAAQGQCLSREEQRKAVNSGQAIRPGRLGNRLGGKVLRLRLCHGGGGLVWQVTVLGRDGRVVGHVVDAQSGQTLR
ncbi:PepSY domain-containing protein [Acuticoccus kandeliae]|uniref:PepSY domain-containing protein n=1 Tax=Acuticoccus kandeliae TaxID=2073160 RepID=UPI001474F3EB|nr:hypothetical protein [Acuticoccus kandeliae]